MEESYAKIIYAALNRLYDMAIETAHRRGLYREEVKDDYKTVKQTIDWNLAQMKLWKIEGYNKGRSEATIRTFFRMIHDVCNKNRYCEDCPFLRGKCIIYDDSPNEWKLDLINEAIQELREKMEV